MAFQSVPNTVEAIVEMTINAVTITMTFYGLFPGGYGQAEVQDLADVMDAWAGSELAPVLSAQASYDGVNTRGLELLNDYVAFSIASATIGGTASTPLPNNVAKAFRRTSGLTGRSARGRVYAPVAQVHLEANENYVSVAYASAMTLALNNVRTAMTTVGATEVIVSRYTLGALRSFGVTFPVTNYAAVDLTTDSRRDRLP